MLSPCVCPPGQRYGRRTSRRRQLLDSICHSFARSSPSRFDRPTAQPATWALQNASLSPSQGSFRYSRVVCLPRARRCCAPPGRLTPSCRIGLRSPTPQRKAGNAKSSNNVICSFGIRTSMSRMQTIDRFPSPNLSNYIADLSLPYNFGSSPGGRRMIRVHVLQGTRTWRSPSCTEQALRHPKSDVRSCVRGQVRPHRCQDCRAGALHAPLLRQQQFPAMVHQTHGAASDAHGVLAVVFGQRPRPFVRVKGASAGGALLVMAATASAFLSPVLCAHELQHVDGSCFARWTPFLACGAFGRRVDVLHRREGAAVRTRPEVFRPMDLD